MKKIKSLDDINALDLTAIAYAVAVIVGLCSRIDLTVTMLIASVVCAYFSVKSKKIALSILNVSICLYVFGELGSHHIIPWFEQGVADIQEFFDKLTFKGVLWNLFNR